MMVDDLMPAARNAWAISPLGPGLEPGTALDSVVLYDEPHARVSAVAPDLHQHGNPVLLVTPLAVPVTCWDLRPGQSLAGHLSGAAAAGTGRATYTIDYGQMTFADRGMGFEHFVDDLLPTAVERISAEHDGAPVHLVGWSHGGTMSLLLAAHRPDLPIASVAALGTPTDYSLNPAYAPLRWFAKRFGYGPLLLGSRICGGTTTSGTRLGYRLLAPMRELTKPWTLATNLNNPEVLARITAVDRFIDAMPSYPARFFHQSMSTVVCERGLVKGLVPLTDDVRIDMHRLRVPVLLIGSEDDVLANSASVEAGVAAYPNAKVEFVGVRGLSHLGLIASPRAAELTWPSIDRHLASNDRQS